MDLAMRLTVGKILVNEFGRIVDESELDDYEIDEVVKRASFTYLKMKLFAKKYDDPPELIELTERLNNIIKALEIKRINSN